MTLDFNDKIETIRVLLVGAKRSGKTVFLTSLTNHLKVHDIEHDIFDLNGWEAFEDVNILQEYEEKNGEKKLNLPNFDYGSARRKLSSGLWPEKSFFGVIMRMPLRLTKRVSGGGFYRKMLDMLVPSKRKVMLEIVDIPGERVSDFPMYGRSFDEWSQLMLKTFSSLSGYEEYIKYCHRDGITKAEIIDAYKVLVTQICANAGACAIVTPSDLKLSFTDDVSEAEFAGMGEEERRKVQSRRFRSGRTYEELLAAMRAAPLDFAPVDSGTDAKIRADFADAYERYKAEKVNAIFEWVQSATHILYLVDILDMLRKGSEVYNMEQEFGNSVLRMLGEFVDSRPKILRFFIKNTNHLLKKLAVVVTKSDLACSAEYKENLKELAKHLYGKTLRCIPGGDRICEIRYCSAVDTIKEKDGFKARTDPNNENMKDYTVRPVPKKWPPWDEMSKEDAIKNYSYQATLPRFNSCNDAPPFHDKLDELARDILDLN